MRFFLLLLHISFIPALFAQVDLSRLDGNFINCNQIKLLDLYSKHVRPFLFECPNAKGYVMQETPVRYAIIGVSCPNINSYTVKVATLESCNTVGCLEKVEQLRNYANVKSEECDLEIQSAELFEYYPIFSNSGPRADDPFLETTVYNNEDDRDYLSRINGGYSRSSPTNGTIGENDDSYEVVPSEKNKVEIDFNLKEKLCSFSSLPEESFEDYLKLALNLYQNPEFEEEKLQRKLFCLLKDYYERSEDYDHLMELIAKMKFKEEQCH